VGLRLVAASVSAEGGTADGVVAVAQPDRDGSVFGCVVASVAGATCAKLKDHSYVRELPMWHELKT
jgi:hypothetical protein